MRCDCLGLYGVLLLVFIAYVCLFPWVCGVFCSSRFMIWVMLCGVALWCLLVFRGWGAVIMICNLIVLVFVSILCRGNLLCLSV